MLYTLFPFFFDRQTDRQTDGQLHSLTEFRKMVLNCYHTYKKGENLGTKIAETEATFLYTLMFSVQWSVFLMYSTQSIRMIKPY